MTRLQLLWNDPDTQTQQQYTGSLPITIGRGKDNSIVLSHKNISRYHARLERRDGKLLLLDQKSQNGTFTKGQRITEATLQPGDSFAVGKISFTLRKEPLSQRIRSRLGLFWPVASTDSTAHAVISRQNKQVVISQSDEEPIVLPPGESAKIGSASLTILPNLTIGAESDVGKKRANRPNQDAIGLFSETPVKTPEMLEKGMLFLVADGMGGAAGGQEASQIAASTTIKEYYASASPSVIPTELRGAWSDPDIKHRLEHSIQAANVQIYKRGHEEPDVWGMGTTIVAAVIQGNQLVVANVGDSRAYLFRKGQLKQLTTDHTLVQGLLDVGLISAEEASRHPRRNVLSRNLGSEQTVHPDVQTHTLQQGDVILLCSDGLWGVLKEQEISSVLQGQQGHQAAHTLIEMANEHGGPDNISVIVLHVAQLPAAQKAS
ncbi:MAG: Stp1/IreP family PP2C-type Ser/Thr phosphatase [Ardenticatenaceae bacterium]